MKTLALKAFTILGSRVLTHASQVVAFVLLARVLSPAGFGAYGVLTSAVFLSGQVGNLGLRQSAAHRIGQKRMSDGDAMGVMLAFWPPAAVVCAGAVLWFNGKALGDLTAGAGAFGPQTALALAAAGVLFTVLVQGVFLGRGEIRNFSVAEAGPRMLQSAFIAVLWLAGLLTVATAMWSFALGFLLLIPFTAWLALRGASPLRLPLAEGLEMVRHGLIFAASMFLITLQGRVGVFWLSAVDGPEAAGHLFAAQRGVEIVLELATAVGLVLFSEATRSGSLKNNMAATLKTALLLSGMFLVIGATAALAAPLVVPLVLGEAYTEAVPVVRVLALGLAPAAFVKIMNSVVAGSGKPTLSAAVIGGALLMNTSLAYILVPSSGALGAAWASVCSFSMAAGVYLFATLRFRTTRVAADAGDIKTSASDTGAGTPPLRG
ncbi:lipopolysaccharide biosynthesis protein [Brevundimonas balnearis]|uniref:Lipopolysaccharide biosynthesis protein n=1 Tax=Brevundimonas balnearis TaxID=1572858 RepID=A0ABV6QYM9_9CAUL